MRVMTSAGTSLKNSTRAIVQRMTQRLTSARRRAGLIRRFERTVSNPATNVFRLKNHKAISSCIRTEVIAFAKPAPELKTARFIDKNARLQIEGATHTQDSRSYPYPLPEKHQRNQCSSTHLAKFEGRTLAIRSKVNSGIRATWPTRQGCNMRNKFKFIEAFRSFADRAQRIFRNRTGQSQCPRSKRFIRNRGKRAPPPARTRPRDRPGRRSLWRATFQA